MKWKLTGKTCGIVLATALVAGSLLPVRTGAASPVATPREHSEQHDAP